MRSVYLIELKAIVISMNMKQAITCQNSSIALGKPICSIGHAH